LIIEERGFRFTGHQLMIPLLTANIIVFAILPCYAVSIGVEYRGRSAISVIYDPTRAGATGNGQPIRVNEMLAVLREISD
jgi:hypothetical protein